MFVRDSGCTGWAGVSFSTLIIQRLCLHESEQIAALALEFLEDLCLELIQRDNQLAVSDVGISI